MILVNHMNQEIVIALPQNDPELVETNIHVRLYSQSPVPINDRGDTVPIVEALTSHFEFTKLTLPLLKNADSAHFNMKNYLNVFKMSYGRVNML